MHAACPHADFGRAYDPLDHKTAHALFRRARAEAPVFFNEELGYWVLTRREDALVAMRDADRFSADIALAPLAPYPDAVVAALRDGGFTTEPTNVNCDRPKHTRIRALAAQFLNMRRFNAMEGRVRELTREAIAKMHGKGRVDLVADLTYELPARVLFELLGITDMDAGRIKRWGDNRLMMIFGRPTPDELRKGGEELLDFFLYCKSVVQARIDAPGDNYAGKLLELRGGDDAVLTMNEIVSMVFGLMLAGHETTTNASGNLILELLSAPDQWAAVRDDPALIANAVEEGLRHASSVIAWRRRALEDVEFSGVKIPKDAKILIALASANRDEDRFEDGERFVADRKNARDHIAFGNGIHFCIGAPLARLEMRVMLEELARAFPNMTLAPGQDVDFIRTIAFRGPHALHVDLNEG